jgi:hypothetical protein
MIDFYYRNTIFCEVGTDFLAKLAVAQPLKKFQHITETRVFITVFIRSGLRSLSWARWIQPIHPHTISLRSILILSSHLRLDLAWILFKVQATKRSSCTTVCSLLWPLSHSAVVSAASASSASSREATPTAVPVLHASNEAMALRTHTQEEPKVTRCKLLEFQTFLQVKRHNMDPH